MKGGFGQHPWTLVKVQCRRCHKRAGEHIASLDGSGPFGMGVWKHLGWPRCRCDPPVKLPEGEKLATLRERARKKYLSGDRKAIRIYR